MLQGLSGQWFVARQSKGQGQKSQVLSGPQHAILVIAVLSTPSSSYEFQLQGAPFTSENSGVSESRGTRGAWAGGGAGETTAVLSASPKGGSLQTIVGEATSDPHHLVVDSDCIYDTKGPFFHTLSPQSVHVLFLFHTFHFSLGKLLLMLQAPA